jgi:phosphoribosylanthranilate isomerase
MTLIKLCGITNLEDGLAAAALGADYIGLIFYPPSPRYVAPSVAARILSGIRREFQESAPQAIGVFVNEKPAVIMKIQEEAGLNGLQFVGEESPEEISRFSPVRIRALSLETLDRLGRYEVEAYLCDAHAPKEKGGTGKAYDYEMLRPYLGKHRIIIAGGLTPETVGDVVRSLKPYGVDVSSAIEQSPGKKDHAKMQTFVEVVRGAE